MSTFSSIVNKSGKKFTPKSIARGNVVSRAFSITPSYSDPPPTPRPVLPSIQTPVEAPGVSQVQNATEQDAASSAPPVLVPQTAGISTLFDIAPPGTYPLTNVSRAAENPRLTDSTMKDATRGRRATKQGKTYKDRVITRQSRAQATAIGKNGSAHQQPSLSEANREHGANFDEESPSLALSSRSATSREDGTKRKSAALAVDAPGIAAEYSAANRMLDEGASTDDFTPRKRQKVLPKGPRHASATGASRSATAPSVEGHTVTPMTASPAATEIEDATVAPPKATRKGRAKKTMQEVAAEVVADAVGDASETNGESTASTTKKTRKRKRKVPQGAEGYKIAPSEVKMADLVKDKGLGKGSTLEARLEEVDWDEVKKKRKEAAEDGEKRRELEREEKRTGRPARQDDVPAAPTVPKLTIRDNQIVMEEESRIVDRHADIDIGNDETIKVQDVNDLTRRVNQSTIGRQSGVKQKGHWNDEMTDLFYKGLRMFGTDFMMISKMFPGMSRRHIKLKYTREERINLARINKNLIAKEDVDMEEYSQMSNQVYEDPEIVKGDIRAEEQRLRDEDVAKRARETEAAQGEVDAEVYNVLQSREQGTADPTGGEERETTALETESSAKENRLTSVARSIVQQATAPKKAKKQNALARKRERKKKTGLEGTEEVVGSIEDMQRE